MNVKTIVLTLVIGALFGALGVLWQRPTLVFGNGSADEANYATTTIDTTWPSATTYKTLKVGSGVLTAIIVGSSSPATPNLPSLRCFDSSVSTSTASSTLALVGSAAAEGTRSYDAVFNAGLICEATPGFKGGYTITWK